MDLRKDTIGYFAKEENLPRLLRELKNVEGVYGQLVLAHGGVQQVFWASNIWYRPQIISAASIKLAAEALKAIQRNWIVYTFHEHRRGTLIQEALPHVSAKPLVFPGPLPSAPLGGVTLLDRETLLASAECSSPVPHGSFLFAESKVGPPNRAYLKLWELFSRFQKWPGVSDRCLDVGAAPGGWSWVLATLGAQVQAIDRSPPDDNPHPRIKWNRGDGTAVLPTDEADYSWVFSDMAIEPHKAEQWITQWLDAPTVPQIVCTLKFKGEENYSVAHRLCRHPRLTVTHLAANKHELTVHTLGSD